MSDDRYSLKKEIIKELPSSIKSELPKPADIRFKNYLDDEKN